jgi:hypothetical protein
MIDNLEIENPRRGLKLGGELLKGKVPMARKGK